ncbi:MAG: hypothetical protein IT454_09615 [Planctomycetes bacterium]|nr:hypothetical protein [Planctomycetota bacterium]
MSLAGPLLGMLLAIATGAPLPCAAWVLARRARGRRWVRTAVLCTAAAASWISWSAGTLALRPSQPPTQHSMFEGLDQLAIWVMYGFGHALWLCVLLVLDARRALPEQPRMRK